MNFWLVIQHIGILFCFGNALQTLNRIIVVENGEDVVLPCLVTENIVNDDESVIWMKNETSILFINNLSVTLKNASNIRLEGQNFTLVIKNFTLFSNGLYTCRLAIVPHSVTYDVRIKEPPSVVSIDGDTVIEIGDNLDLTCITSGFPAPNITWYRQKTALLPKQSFHNEEKIFFENVNEGVSGVYTCVASYNGTEDSKSVTVNVFRGLQAESEVVHVEPAGEDTKLCCLRNRTKDVNWWKDGVKFTFDYYISDEITNHKSCLVFHKVEFQDLGNYTCQSTRQSSTIYLSGLLKPPQLISRSNDSLTWKGINGGFPILEYYIFVKPAGDKRAAWKLLSKEEIDSIGKNEYIISHKFLTLAPGKYDVKLEVRNQINVNQVINYNAFVVDDELMNGANCFLASILYLWTTIVLIVWIS